MYLRLGSQRNEYYFFNFLWKAPNFYITFEQKVTIKYNEETSWLKIWNFIVS